MGRAPCCDKDGLKKGPWTPEEDQKLIDYINQNGCGNWRTLPKNAGLQRCGKSCRLRWTNYLRPDIKRGRFSFEEEETIIQLHSILGNKWSAIAARLPGRTDNEIKNYWNTHIRKRLMRMGIDPVTHSPRLDLLDISTILNSSIYNSSQPQINFTRLLGMQSLINPELIRLASSILSSQNLNQENLLTQNQIFSHNSQISNQIPTPLMQNQVQDHLPIPTSLEATNCVPNISQQHEVMQYEDVHQFQQNLPGFGPVNHDWQQSIENYVPYTNYGCYGLDQPEIHDPAPSSDTSTFDQSNSNNNFSSFQSVFSSGISTRSSSPTLNSNSNSNYVNSSSSTTEDERESYCSSMLKYEISDYSLDVNDYM